MGLNEGLAEDLGSLAGRHAVVGDEGVVLLEQRVKHGLGHAAVAGRRRAGRCVDPRFLFRWHFVRTCLAANNSGCLRSVVNVKNPASSLEHYCKW
jgi:hypothetical protein